MKYVNFKRFIKCAECGKVRNVFLFPSSHYPCCKICKDRIDKDFYIEMDAYYRFELDAKNDALFLFKSCRSDDDYLLLEEFLEDELHDNSIGNFRIVDKVTGSGIIIEDDLPFDVYCHQTCNGGYSGDDYSGTIYIKIKDKQFIAYDYSC